VQALEDLHGGQGCQMRFFVERQLFKDKFQEQMEEIQAINLDCTQDTEVDHLAPLGAFRHIEGLEHFGIDPNGLENLALFCVRCHGLKTSMEKVLAKEAARAGDRSVGVHSCCMRFCVVCDPACRLTPRGNPITL
jgi:hypothetical protein